RRRARRGRGAGRGRRGAAVRGRECARGERAGRARARRAGVGGGAMRIACVFVPQLALQAVLRRTPEARGGPVAVLAAANDNGKAKAKRIARVTEISPEARREGVRAGMTGAQATAVCAGLRLLTVTAADREAACAALNDGGYAFAPRIERADHSTGATGFARIFFESEDLARLYPA